MIPLIQSQNSPTARRSTRKTKAIHREFYPYSKFDRQKRREEQSQLRSRIPAQVEVNCQKLMKSDRKADPSTLLREMERAISLQCQKLQICLQIKLQLGQKCSQRVFQPTEILLKEPVEVQEVQKFMIQEGLNDQKQLSIDYWSLPESLGQKPILRRHQSARLLCDNYQKQELIYSVQTLIPRLLREDIEHHI